MRKVTVNHAVKQSFKYRNVRLQFTPFSVYLSCHNDWGLTVNTFKLADRCSSFVPTSERRKWADKVLAAYLKFKIRYKSEQVGVHTWRVARVHDDKRVGQIVKVGFKYVVCDAGTVPRHRFNNFKDAFNFIVNGGLNK